MTPVGFLFLPVTCLVRHSDFHNDHYVKVNAKPVLIQHLRICCSYVHRHESLICTDAEMRWPWPLFHFRTNAACSWFLLSTNLQQVSLRGRWNVLYSETLVEANVPLFIHTENVRTFWGKGSMFNKNKAAEMTLSAIQTSVSVQPQSVSSKETQQTVRLSVWTWCNPSTAISKLHLWGKWLQFEVSAWEIMVLSTDERWQCPPFYTEHALGSNGWEVGPILGGSIHYWKRKCTLKN